MKLEDIHIGMKVVPHDKTGEYPGLHTSTVWSDHKEQGFLYVTDIRDISDGLGYEICLDENPKGRYVSGDFFMASDVTEYIETKQEEQEVKQTFPPQGKVTVTVEHSPNGDSFVVYIVGDIHKRLINVRLNSNGTISSITEENGYPFEFNRDSQEERVSSLKDMIDTVIDRVIELDEESLAANRNMKLIKDMLSQYTGE